MLLNFRKQNADFAGNRYRVRVENETMHVRAFEVDVDKQNGYFHVVYRGIAQQHDGQRLHHQALSQPDLQLDPQHHVVGLYVGGPAQYPRRVRIQQMSQEVCGKKVYLWMHESRRPVIEVSAESLVDELRNRFGIS